jgi:hypothetical protein
MISNVITFAEGFVKIIGSVGEKGEHKTHIKKGFIIYLLSFLKKTNYGFISHHDIVSEAYA